MRVIPLPSNLTRIKIFTENFENDETVFYHGSSSIYSNQIEQFGLFPNHKILTQHFYSIFNFAYKVYCFTASKDNDFGTFNKVFKAASEYFNSFMRISFSAVSYSAAYYSTGEMAGGQGLRHLVNLKNELEKIDFTLLKNCSINISETQLHYYKNINADIYNIRNSDGVVYAIKFEQSDIIHLSYEEHSCHSVLFSVNHIQPAKIVAKIVIPFGINLDRALIDISNEKTLELSQPTNTTKFIRDIIFSNLERNEFNNNKESI